MAELFNPEMDSHHSIALWAVMEAKTLSAAAAAAAAAEAHFPDIAARENLFIDESEIS